MAAAWVLGPGWLSAKSPSTPVIMISVDTLRADHLGCYGYKRLRTPNIDFLAEGGTLFEQVTSQVPLTLPSHASLFTSTYPFSNGVEDHNQILPASAVTLAETLKEKGYRTAAFIGGFVLDGQFGLRQGFDVYHSPFASDRLEGTDPGDLMRSAEEVVREGIKWIGGTRGAPFFLFLHLYDTHTPYRPPSPFRERYRQAPYDGEIAYVDQVLGGLWEFLRQRDLLDRCLIVFLSDHGEGLGEHGESTHGYYVYQSTLRVPLLIRWPRLSEPNPRYPARVDEPVSLLDVAPTVLGFLGLQRPAPYQGRNLLRIMQGQASPAAIYSESRYAQLHFNCVPLRTLRLGRYKYIEAPKPELYDLLTDPGETKNIYPQKVSLAAALRAKMASLRNRYRPVHPVGDWKLSADAVARLRSLGYLGGTQTSSVRSEAGHDPKDRIGEFSDFESALVEAREGRIGNANKILGQLLASDPELSDVRLTLALNYQRQGDYARASRELEKFLQGDPSNFLAHYNLAVSYANLNRTPEAMRELEAALTVAPNNARARAMLGLVLLRQEKFDQAEEQFKRVLKGNPKNFTALYNWGVLSAQKGQWDRAEDNVRKALEIDPENAEAHDTLGKLYMKKGELDGAASEFQKAFRLDPRFAAAHYNLGLVFRRRNLRERAAQEFRKALEIDPSFQLARKALAALGRIRGS